MMRTTLGSGAPLRSAEAISARASASSACSSAKRSRGTSDRLEAQALDAVHVHAFEPDQTGGALAAGRMQVALVVQVHRSRSELVSARCFGAARLVGACRRYERIVGHVGLALGLAVDRPRRTVIVGRRILRALVLVGEDAETELAILVDDFSLRR